MNRLCIVFGSLGLAATATALILGGLAVLAAAQRGDLPVLHLHAGRSN
jgi:hypothetical protein